MRQRILAGIIFALLGSPVGMAASVEVIMSPPGGVCCVVEDPRMNTDVFVTLHAVAFPGNGTTTGTTGSTLTITYNPAVLSLTGVALSPGSPFDFIAPPNVVNAHTAIIAVLRNAAGYAYGTFDAYRINFRVIGAGFADIFVLDDGADNSWTDQDANPISVTYKQYGAVPVPAAFWLLGSALGVLGCVRRRLEI